ncbi:D-alanyl-D-alanine carboxypeptidase family protein [Leucobacter chromiiresistens]|uniref:D-alanyl-D-alanine carboxypeptidase (Penicillin-binding protein 5/6) n=2 Tax=Leucobacter chromiiresistens TaxID=1079994 RepID=A0A1H0XZU4_9MICO|nr:D-alanyl-D-alanine carboxypeptidase [Leucobacter chromiiresistens]SDQ08365.1 D-alanyl-D-alanine carboxypeptidase (penicillin-binding protein 5/6) [Leucobacter chromiiresistens]
MSSTSAPHRAPHRAPRPRTRRLVGLGAAGLAALLALAYAVLCAIAPLPEPVVRLDEPATARFSADAAGVQRAVDAEQHPTAVGWLHDDAVWTNSERAAPIASISKLVTALVVLDAQPVEAGSDGPTHIWTAEDAARQAEYLAEDGVAFPIPVGTEVTARQMLQLALVPSANDFAAAYAYSVFGDDAGFLAAVRDWQQRAGLASLELHEPTGMDERNAASAADVLRLARLALENETVAEIVALPRVDLPWGIGTVESTNPLHGVLDGVVGVKTGRTNAAGYNLAAARTSDALSREVVQLSVVLGRDSDEDRLRSSLDLFSALDAAPRRLAIVEPGERLGTATTVDGAEIPILADGGADAVLLPGEEATRTASLRSGGFSEAGEPDAGLTGADAAAGRSVGAIRVAGPGEPRDPAEREDPAEPDAPADRTVDLVTGADVVAPSYGWRLTHPRELFTWS